MNKKNIFITLIVILIVVVSMMFFEGSKSIMHEDIIIKDVNSPNVHLNNILKDNYLLIDFIGRWHLGTDINMNYYNQLDK